MALRYWPDRTGEPLASPCRALAIGLLDDDDPNCCCEEDSSSSSYSSSLVSSSSAVSSSSVVSSSVVSSSSVLSSSSSVDSSSSAASSSGTGGDSSSVDSSSVTSSDSSSGGSSGAASSGDSIPDPDSASGCECSDSGLNQSYTLRYRWGFGSVPPASAPYTDYTFIFIGQCCDTYGDVSSCCWVREDLYGIGYEAALCWVASAGEWQYVDQGVSFSSSPAASDPCDPVGAEFTGQSPGSPWYFRIQVAA